MHVDLGHAPVGEPLYGVVAPVLGLVPAYGYGAAVFGQPVGGLFGDVPGRNVGYYTMFLRIGHHFPEVGVGRKVVVGTEGYLGYTLGKNIEYLLKSVDIHTFTSRIVALIAEFAVMAANGRDLQVKDIRGREPAWVVLERPAPGVHGTGLEVEGVVGSRRREELGFPVRGKAYFVYVLFVVFDCIDRHIQEILLLCISIIGDFKGKFQLFLKKKRSFLDFSRKLKFSLQRGRKR